MAETLYTADIDSPIGDLRIASSESGLAYVALPGASGRGFAGWRSRHAPDAVSQPGFAPNQQAVSELIDFLEGKLTRFTLALDIRATDFQKAVYEEVAAIPYGETRSYSDVARAIGRPDAVRAVGAANGANPVALVVPCHRVVAQSGKLQGYAGGLALKARLLAMEGSRPAQGRLL